MKPIDEVWYEQQTDGLSDCLQELINDGGAEKAQEGLCDAIMTWIDYHQQELNKWKELATLLHLPIATGTGSTVLNSKSFSTPSMLTGNRL